MLGTDHVAKNELQQYEIMIKKARAFLLALLTTYVIGAVTISQFNIARIVDMGFPVDTNERFATAWHDLTHMYDLYLPLVAIALLIAFLVNGLGILKLFNMPRVLYPLAGFAGLLTLHLTLEAVLGMTPVAPARDFWGLMTQGIAGGVGGWVFYRFKEQRN